MRDITDDRSSISELQRFLRELHHDTRGKIPLVNPDGIYGDETRAAVRAFREQNGLPEGDYVDNEAWDAIYSEYRRAQRRRERPSAVYPFPEDAGYTVKPGEVSDTAAFIQLMLRLLRDIYDGIEGGASDGIYSKENADDVAVFQRARGLVPTGEVDRLTWDALAEAYNRQARVQN